MGSSESRQQENSNTRIFENPEQLKDEILKQFSLELQSILKNLENSKLVMEKTAYNKHKQQMEELKIKFMEFYKFTQINDGMVKRLSTTNAELENTLGEYKKELLKYKKEKEDLKENLVIKEKILLSKRWELQRSLRNEKQETFKERQLRTKAEIELQSQKQNLRDIINKQSVNFKDLQEKLVQNQQNLEKEKILNQEVSSKLQLVTQYSEKLKSQLEEKEVQQQKDLNYFKLKMNQLENQLCKTKINLSKSRKDVRQLEESKKKSKITSETKEKELDGCLKQLEVFKEQHLGTTHSAKDKTAVDRLFFDFVSNYHINLNSEKQEKIKSDYEDTLRKYEETIEKLRNELKTNERRLQLEEKLKKEVQGKLFLVENNFQSLNIFCKKELQNQKNHLNEERDKQKRGNNFPSESCGSIPSKNKKSSVKQENLEFLQETFCANQQKEMNQLHQEFQSIIP